MTTATSPPSGSRRPSPSRARESAAPDSIGRDSAARGSAGRDSAGFRPSPVVAPSEQIRSQVVAAISKGHLQPGDLLPSEGNLAREFGVSSAQVRAGLNALVNLGLIEITRGRGGGLRVARPDPRLVQQTWHNTLAVLADLDDVSLAELAEARREAEIVCARAAAQRRTDEDLARMSEVLDDALDPALSSPQWLAMDISFHRAVADAAHNQVLALPLVAVHAVSQPRLNELIADLLDRNEVTRQHRAIYQAITDGVAEEAAEAVRRHVVYLEGLYVQVAESAQRGAAGVG